MVKRREYLYTKKCEAEGCREFERYIFRNAREYDNHAKFRTMNPFACTRHDRPKEVLSLDQTGAVVVYTVKPDQHGMKRFYGGRVNVTQLGGGFDGYQAYAEDFEPGTQIVLHAYVVRVCQVAHNLPEACCGVRVGDGGYNQCEEVGLHERHRVGEHTIMHSLRGNGYDCQGIDALIRKQKDERERAKVPVPGDGGAA